MGAKPEFSVVDTLDALGRAAARRVKEIGEASIRERGVFTLVLSGGNTPRVLYRQWASFGFYSRAFREATHFFWGDERFVPFDHAGSNYGTTAAAFLHAVRPPERNVHPVPVEKGAPEQAARAYEENLRRFFASRSGGSGSGSSLWPSFDLILLGMGRDGHTASLFPGAGVLEEKTRWVAVEPRPARPPRVPRVTLTLPLINRARHVLFLVAGREKACRVCLVRTRPEEAARSTPAARVNALESLTWLIQAASFRRDRT